MKRILSRFLLFNSLIFLSLSHAFAGGTKAVITMVDTCSNSDSVYVSARHCVLNAGDSVISYAWKFTRKASIPTSNADSVAALIFKDTANLLGVKDTIWLKIYTKKGDSDSVMRVYTIKYNFIPTFTVKSSCADSLISFVNTTDSTYGNGKYTWDYGDGSAKISSKNIPPHKYAVSGVYYPTVSVYWQQTGCFNKSSTLGNPAYLYAKPRARLVAIKKSCQDSNILFSDTSFTLNSTFDTYTWDFGDTSGTVSISASATDTITHSYKYTGTKAVSLITITENGCRDTDNLNIIINPTPKAGFSFSTPCQKAITKFTNSSTIASPGVIASYDWDFGDGKNSTLQNPSHVYSSPSNYRVHLTLTSKDGCIDTISSPLLINQTPPVNIASTGACVKDSAFEEDFTTYIVGDTAQKYIWDFGDLSKPDTETVRKVFHAYAKSGTYKVKMIAITQSGCNIIDSNTVKIAAKPVATFISAGSCSGQAVSFVDKSTVSGDVIVSQIWDFNDSTNSTTTNPNNTTGSKPNHYFDSSGTYNVTLISLSKGGCADTVTQSVTILQSPDTTFTSTNACENSKINFTYTGRVTAGLKYFWNFGDPTTKSDTSSLRNPVYTYATGGLYTVNITTKDKNGCQSSGPSNVYVYPKPKVTIYVDEPCVDSLINFTDSTLFDPNLKIIPSITNYLWDFGDSSTPVNTTTDGIQHQYKYTGAHTVTLTVTTSDTCTATGTFILNVAPKPIPWFTFTNGCNVLGIPFADSSYGATIAKYAWDFLDASPVDSNQNPTHVYLNTSSTQSTLHTVISDKGCRAEIQRDLNTYQAPSSDFTNSLSGPPYRQCTLIPISFFQATVPASGESSAKYSWIFGDGNTDTGANVSHSFTNAGKYIVRLISYSQHGCPDTTSLKSINYQFNIDPRPVADFSLKGSKVCQGTPVSFYDETNFNGVQPGTIFWDFGDGATDFTNQYPLHTYGAATSYHVRLYRENAVAFSGCPSDTFDSVITIFPKPKAYFSYLGTCQNSPTQFLSDSSTVAAPAILDTAKYAWDFYDGSKSNEKDPYHTYNAAGYYNVTLSVTTDSAHGACPDDTSRLIYVQPAPTAAFFATPNPVGNDTAIVTFLDSSLGINITNRIWDFGDSTPFVKNPGLTNNTHQYHPADPIDTGTYRVKLLVTNAFGCSDSAFQYVKVKQILKLDGRFPDAFSPNGDGLNDIWHPKTRGVFQYTCIIVDRWGQILYKTDDWNDIGWKGDYLGNGVMVPEGVYVFYCTLTDYDNVDLKKITGTITVTR